MRNRTVIIAALLSLGLAREASAQTWTTAAGGDASGDYVRIERTEPEGALSGTRHVERIDAPSGYTTGTSARIVFDGPEPEPQRTLRVHLPYGAALDLAVGDEVEVEASSQRRGLGSVHEVQVTRRGEIILLTTARDRVASVRVARGTEAPSQASRHEWGLRVRIGRTSIETAPRQLYYVGSMLVMGSDIAYPGPRPPDAFDQRMLTLVRIRPLAP